MSLLRAAESQALACRWERPSVPKVLVSCPVRSKSVHQCRHSISAYPVVRRQHTTSRVASGETSTSQQDVMVEEVMNPHPVLLQETLSMKEAVHKLLDANVSGAPVVNGKGQIVGVLSESDIIWKGAGKPEDHFIIPPVFIGALDAYVFLRDNKAFEQEANKILARTVADAMVGKDKVISVKPGMSMSDAAQLMLHHNVNLLPVVEADNSVVGVVTRHDILRGIYASKNPLL